MRKGRFAGLSMAPADMQAAAARFGPAAAAVAGAPLLVALAVSLGLPLSWIPLAGIGGALIALVGMLSLRRRDPAPIVVDPDAARAEGFVAGFEESGRGWFWETNADGRIVYVSAWLAEALGRDQATLVGGRFDELLLIEESDAAEQPPTLGFHLASRFPFDNVPVAPNGQGDVVWSLSGRPRFDEVGRFLGFRGAGLTLSERERDGLRAGRMAACDSLTGLANRARMRDMLDEALANADSRKEGCALLLIDLDRFKPVNDTLGHPIGDLLLKEVALRLVAAVGDMGQVGRHGGDEFEAVLPGVDEEGRLAALAERIVTTLAAPYSLRGHSITIGASIGIAISRPGRTLAESLIKEADLALYAAKHAGRGTYRFFEPEMHAEESSRHMLENDLKLAVNKGELRLVFQPIVSAASEDLVGFEALLRWMHPVRGPLAPADFLPLAEASGLIVGIGDWVMRTACAEAAKWPHHLRLAVNLSRAEAEQPQLTGTVAGALAASGLEPERLELDLTEDGLRGESEATRAALSGLKALGVRLTLDDFGDGSADLLTLKKAPLDRIKIHPDLLRAGLTDGSRAEALITAVAGLAEGIGIGVTAEGVETLEMLALARRLGCVEIQGFLFGRPMAAAETLEMAAASRPVDIGEEVQPRAPRHSLIRRGILSCEAGETPVRLRNVSAEGAMIESDQSLDLGERVELDLADGVRLAGEVRWSQDGRIGLRFAESFDLRRLGRAKRTASGGLVKPDYLRSELQPDSPWAARRDRLSIKDVKRK
jgi:diguanylate cyclase (GGDEF)-like protein